MIQFIRPKIEIAIDKDGIHCDKCCKFYCDWSWQTHATCDLFSGLIVHSKRVQKCLDEGKETGWVK